MKDLVYFSMFSLDAKREPRFCSLIMSHPTTLGNICVVNAEQSASTMWIVRAI